MTLLLKKLESYKRAGEIVTGVLDEAVRSLRAGTRVLDLAEQVEREIIERGAQPAFPTTISRNSEVAYHTPSAETTTCLHHGDLLKIDAGAHIGGYIVDRAITYEVETDNHQTLITAAQTALRHAILTLHDGVTTAQITESIAASIESTSFKPICSCTGHTLERNRLHGDIRIPICPEKGNYPLNTGDVVAIEVFLTNGTGSTAQSASEIYSVKRHSNLRNLDVTSRNFASGLLSNFGTLPFAIRWLRGTRAQNVEKIRSLLKFGAIREYPALFEASGGIVAESEQTLMVLEDGCLIL